MAKTVLVINSGSSSIKYQLVDLETGEGLASGLVEKIGEPIDGHYKHEFNGEKHELEEPIHDHEQGLKRVLDLFGEYGPKLEEAGIVAVGHRVVQGGSVFPQPALVNDKTIGKVKDLAVLAPLHNGPEAIGAEVMRALLPDVPQVFVFDSSFFFQLPKEASTYALNKDIADKYHIRRYGAHGTSHEYIGSVVPEVVGKPAEGLKQIVLHVGNGASASAQISGRPIDTSMGLTPLEGLVMGGRTGDIDPAVVFHLIRNAHMNVDELDTLFNKRSGMMGMTGFGDLREVHRLIAEGDENAKLALDVYIHRIVGYIGNYTAQLGGLDVLTFTAGVGENDDIVRAAVCDKLAPFGVKLDAEKNATRSKDPRIISTPDSSVIVAVIPTNEELAIARKSAALAQAGKDSYGNVFTR
ncbi:MULTISPECIES: acetate/propionate family kinase [Bifidobacterium]|jgi:acetate kinase|uniref:Acetate kinase n=1 Tax=Bifidobacterium tibiigranuli TaxID=2172043 RepID=A0A5N6SA04_9BIFI|nr:acetate kinase [Bifidobacterium tibiigranuli]KAE8130151.1 acetate kinase [Bifidobacterium tibiigranuli]KAE8130491.1 acetate kinase [Bifidobacterium tibiigranuli]MCH3974696.1 acetate kinase [Bifidobacterium tibiigranuli]MCH4188944.1 acetate kinase [Bifidobacterium tibiigranuli]MCH4203664.1 acetate kinase [Bifidobacterium tibiigranuli]